MACEESGSIIWPPTYLILVLLLTAKGDDEGGGGVRTRQGTRVLTTTQLHRSLRPLPPL